MRGAHHQVDTVDLMNPAPPPQVPGKVTLDGLESRWVSAWPVRLGVNSPRIGYANPQLDALLSKQRATFDPNERKAVLSQAMSLITE